MIDGMTERRLSQFEALSATHAAVVFVGDSITEGGLWSEWLPGVDVINRGISGNTTQDILDRMPHIVSVKPDKLFLMIGVNDLNKRLGVAVALRNYTTLIRPYRRAAPQHRGLHSECAASEFRLALN